MNVGCQVGKESITLNSIKPVATEEAQKDPNFYGLDYMVLIQILDNYGYSDSSRDYLWYDNCWHLNDVPVADSVTFPAGQGFWVSNYTYLDVKLQASGEVQQTDIDFPLDLEGGAVGVINAYPTPVKIADLTPIASEDAQEDPNFYGLDYMILIQILDNYGYSDSSRDYLWYEDCWHLNDIPVSETATFPAGEGLWVSNYTYLPVSLHIPAPEL